MDRALNREILRLSLPSILANLTVPLVGFVDTAIAGHLHGGASDVASSTPGAAAFIGAVSVGAMIFNLIYWNFAFLRTGTGGLTAQAFGRGDFRECGACLRRALALALASAAVTLALQWPFLKLALLCVNASPEVEALASQYFLIRVWAAPATLSLMAFSGWFVGMQDSVSSMWKDLVVNGVNIAASLLLSFGLGGLFPSLGSGGASPACGSGGFLSSFSFGGASPACGSGGFLSSFGSGGASPAFGSGIWEGLGFAGVAWGTVAAQYSGLIFCVLVYVFKYRRRILAGAAVLPSGRRSGLLRRLWRIACSELSRRPGLLRCRGFRGYFRMNLNLVARSLGFTAIYIGYTMIAAGLGDLMLACSSILMQIMMIFSYFTDGFAYAGEALTGRFIGACDPLRLRRSVKYIFAWSMSIAVLFIFIYAALGMPMLSLLTDDEAVVEACRQFLPWLVLMPPLGCAAFTWDGVYLGATASSGIRDAMLLAAVAFFAVWFCLSPLLPAGPGPAAASAASASAASAAVPGPAAASAASVASVAVPGPAASASLASAAVRMHLLLAAYFAHLLARTVLLSLRYRREVLSKT